MDSDTNVRFYFSSDEHSITGIMVAGVLFSPPSQLTAHLRAVYAERDALRAELAQAQADAAALRLAIWTAHFDIHYRHKDSWTWEECPKPTCYPLRDALTSGAGAALLAELAAARAVVEAVKERHWECPGNVLDALYAYNALVKEEDNA